MDSETQQIYSDGEKIADYVASRGWPIVKQIFMDKITDLQSIKNLESATATKMMQDVKIRLVAVDILLEIIREVEGRAQQHAGNSALMQDKTIIEL